MKAYIIDTNALISFVTDREPAQQKVVGELFEQAARLKCTMICPLHVLTEFVYVLERVYRVEPCEINAMVAEFIAMAGVELFHGLDMNILLALWPASVPDFGDAVVATVSRMKKGSSVLTFDRRFARVLHRLGIPTAT